MKPFLFAAFGISMLFFGCTKDVDQQTNPENVIQLRTITASIVGNYYATLGGDISDDGGDTVTSRGICWSLNQDPTTKDSTIIAGSGTGIFNVTLQHLLPENRYYAKAFAINKYGTFYGNRVSFITKVLLQNSRVKTVSSVTDTSAQVQVELLDNGGAPVTEVGVYWDTLSPLSTTSNKKVVGSGAGPFTVTLTGLIPNTKYYVLSYAVNKAGSVNGGGNSFITLIPPAPVVTTTPAQIIGGNIITGGTITASASTVILQRGVIYQTNRLVGSAEIKTNDGSGTGTFTSTLTSLFPGSLYNARAYAVWKYGTVYGPYIQFTTPN